MSKCGFYACNNEGVVEARFTAYGGKQNVETKLCPMHDKYTQGGGDLAVLFRRVDHHAGVGYAVPSGVADGPPQPPTGG